MKIRIYKNWFNRPDNFSRSFRTAGKPLLSLDTIKHSTKKIFIRLAKVYAGKKQKEGDLLVVLLDSGYENSKIGNLTRIEMFVRDCLVDAISTKKSTGGEK